MMGLVACSGSEPNVVKLGVGNDPKSQNARKATSEAAKPSRAGAGKMVRIDGGMFSRGTPVGQGDEGEQPRRQIFVNTFWMDLYEVTVRDYKRCVDSGTCSVPDTGGLACSGPQYNWGKNDRLNHPVNCVSIVQARQFCQWVGKRLPTEAEWEKAARGPKDSREYPWGDTSPTCAQACFNGDDQGCPNPTSCPVGTHPAGKSPYGLHDMTGNVWEWVSDHYAEDYYGAAPNRDPKGPRQPTGERVVRGGSFDDIGQYQRLAYRFNFEEPDSFSYVYIGFRCAK